MEWPALWVGVNNVADGPRESNLARETGQLVSSDDFDTAVLVVLQETETPSMSYSSTTASCE